MKIYLQKTEEENTPTWGFHPPVISNDGELLDRVLEIRFRINPLGFEA